MVRDLLRVLDGTTILQVGSDAGRPERVAAGRARQSSLPGAPFDHGQHL
jgi:hypothetical protein